MSSLIRSHGLVDVDQPPREARSSSCNEWAASDIGLVPIRDLEQAPRLLRPAYVVFLPHYASFRLRADRTLPVRSGRPTGPDLHHQHSGPAVEIRALVARRVRLWTRHW